MSNISHKLEEYFILLFIIYYLLFIIYYLLFIIYLHPKRLAFLIGPFFLSQFQIRLLQLETHFSQSLTHVQCCSIAKIFLLIIIFIYILVQCYSIAKIFLVIIIIYILEVLESLCLCVHSYLRGCNVFFFFFSCQKNEEFT